MQEIMEKDKRNSYLSLKQKYTHIFKFESSIYSM